MAHPTIALKFIAVIALALGESLTIYAEISAAKESVKSLNTPMLFKKLLLMIFAGALLLIGFMLGITSFDSIWVVSVISTTLMLLVEPIVAYSFFKILPGKGTTLGLIFGSAGLLCTLIL